MVAGAATADPTTAIAVDMAAVVSSISTQKPGMRAVAIDGTLQEGEWHC